VRGHLQLVLGARLAGTRIHAGACRRPSPPLSFLACRAHSALA
jgi:hypothetical protein